MWDYYAHTSGRGSIKVEQNLRRQEYATVNRECSKERKSFTKETEARCSNTTIMHRHQILVGDQEENPTKPPNNSLPWKIVWWVKGLTNHPIIKVATNVGLLHTQKGERQY